MAHHEDPCRIAREVLSVELLREIESGSAERFQKVDSEGESAVGRFAVLTGDQRIGSVLEAEGKRARHGGLAAGELHELGFRRKGGRQCRSGEEGAQDQDVAVHRRERTWTGIAGPVATTASRGGASGSRPSARTAFRASRERFTKANAAPAIST